MRPYYEHAGITIYHGNCLEVLPQIGRVNLVVTDPPYNVGIDYGAKEDNLRDYEPWCRQWFDELIWRSQAVVLSCGVVNVPMWCRIRHPDWIIAWYKPAAMGSSPFGVCNWEPCLFWGKAKYNRGRDVVVATIIPDQTNEHPCPKPEAWALQLVSLLSDVGGIVLDPFAGSGTTLFAAKQLGRRAIGIEVNERFCELAVRRLSQEILPLSYSEQLDIIY